MRALVTGGAGFVGSSLVNELTAAGVEVLVVDDLSVGDAVPATHPRVQLLAAPFEEARARRAITDFAPDTVFHLAALHFIPWCERHPQEANRVNVEGTRRLLDVLDQVDPGRVVFASTVAVYGFHDEPVVETMPRAPNGVYAHTKVLGEDLLHEYAAAHPGCTVAMPRLANVYGRGDRNEHLLPVLCRKLGDDVSLGNLWPLRDYVHVDDVVAAMLELAELPAGTHVYNVGTGQGTTVEDIVGRLAELSGQPMRAVSDPARQRAADGHLVADPGALQQATGWRPRVPLAEGLADLLESVPAVDQVAVR